MMRPFLAAILLLAPAATKARADVAIPIPELIARPSKFLGKTLIIRRIRCVDPGAPGFVCAALKGQRALRIEASVLGASTDLPIAEKLIGPCKGPSKLDAPTCTFDAVITPHATRQDDGTGGAGTVTVLSSNQIDLLTPMRR